MLAHVSLPVKNYKKSREFYKKVLGAIGYTMSMDHPEWKAGGYNDGKNTDFWIVEKKKMQPAHVAFEVKSKEKVKAFYKTALKAGGKDNGAPGYRKDYWPGYYAAFVFDKDKNNIECVWFDYKAK